MAIYTVEVQYKDAGCFEAKVSAQDKIEAQRKAKAHGTANGYKGAVKKYLVRIEK